MECFVWAAQKQEHIHAIWDTWKQIWAWYTFKITEYRPDQEANLSIWVGNLSFTGKSFGMSVHLLPGTCSGFQQLLTGKARRGAAPSRPCPAAPRAQAVTLQPGKQGNSLPFKGTDSQGLGHISGTCVEPFPAQLGEQGCRLWQGVPSQEYRHLFCPYRNCRIYKIRKGPKHMPGNFVLGCSRVTAPSLWRGIFSI